MTAELTLPTAGEVGDPTDLTVRNFAVCEVQRGMRLIGAAVDAPTAYLVLAGGLHMWLPGRKPIATRQGSLVLLPAGVKPSIAFDPEPALDIAATRSCLTRHEGLLVFDAANGHAGDLRVLVGRVGTGEGAGPGLLGMVSAPVIGDLSDLKGAREAFTRILAELDSPKLGSAAMMAALMKTCLIFFARRFHKEMAAATRPAQTLGARLSGVVSAILAHPADTYCVETLADIAGMSRSTFARQFSEATGIGPMEFVMRARLRRASTLLKETDLSVKQVAAQAGFISRSHFSRAFRDTFGSDPSSFRDQNRNNAVAIEAERVTGGPVSVAHNVITDVQ